MGRGTRHHRGKKPKTNAGWLFVLATILMLTVGAILFYGIVLAPLLSDGSDGPGGPDGMDGMGDMWWSPIPYAYADEVTYHQYHRELRGDDGSLRITQSPGEERVGRDDVWVSGYIAVQRDKPNSLDITAVRLVHSQGYHSIDVDTCIYEIYDNDGTLLLTDYIIPYTSTGDVPNWDRRTCTVTSGPGQANGGTVWVNATIRVPGIVSVSYSHETVERANHIRTLITITNERSSPMPYMAKQIQGMPGNGTSYSTSVTYDDEPDPGWTHHALGYDHEDILTYLTTSSHHSNGTWATATWHMGDIPAIPPGNKMVIDPSYTFADIATRQCFAAGTSNYQLACTVPNTAQNIYYLWDCRYSGCNGPDGTRRTAMYMFVGKLTDMLNATQMDTYRSGYVGIYADMRFNVWSSSGDRIPSTRNPSVEVAWRQAGNDTYLGWPVSTSTTDMGYSAWDDGTSGTSTLSGNQKGAKIGDQYVGGHGNVVTNAGQLQAYAGDNTYLAVPKFMLESWNGFDTINGADCSNSSFTSGETHRCAFAVPLVGYVQSSVGHDITYNIMDLMPQHLDSMRVSFGHGAIGDASCGYSCYGDTGLGLGWGYGNNNNHAQRYGGGYVLTTNTIDVVLELFTDHSGSTIFKTPSWYTALPASFPDIDTNVVGTDMAVSWDAVTGANYYTVQWSVDGAPYTAPVTTGRTTALQTTNSYTIHNINATASYVVRVTAGNGLAEIYGFGLGGESPVTPPTPTPGQPSNSPINIFNFTATPTSPNSAHLTWSDQTGNITHSNIYQVYQDGVLIRSTSAKHATIINLDPERSYVLGIAGTNSTGQFGHRNIVYTYEAASVDPPTISDHTDGITVALPAAYVQDGPITILVQSRLQGDVQWNDAASEMVQSTGAHTITASPPACAVTEYRAKYEDRTQGSDWSVPYSVQPTIGVAPPVSNVRVSDLDVGEYRILYRNPTGHCAENIEVTGLVTATDAYTSPTEVWTIQYTGAPPVSTAQEIMTTHTTPHFWVRTSTPLAGTDHIVGPYKVELINTGDLVPGDIDYEFELGDGRDNITPHITYSTPIIPGGADYIEFTTTIVNWDDLPISSTIFPSTGDPNIRDKATTCRGFLADGSLFEWPRNNTRVGRDDSFDVDTYNAEIDIHGTFGYNEATGVGSLWGPYYAVLGGKYYGQPTAFHMGNGYITQGWRDGWSTPFERLSFSRNYDLANAIEYAPPGFYIQLLYNGHYGDPVVFPQPTATTTWRFPYDAANPAANIQRVECGLVGNVAPMGELYPRSDWRDVIIGYDYDGIPSGNAAASTYAHAVVRPLQMPANIGGTIPLLGALQILVGQPSETDGIFGAEWFGLPVTLIMLTVIVSVGFRKKQPLMGVAVAAGIMFGAQHIGLVPFEIAAATWLTLTLLGFAAFLRSRG